MMKLILPHVADPLNFRWSTRSSSTTPPPLFAPWVSVQMVPDIDGAVVQVI